MAVYLTAIALKDRNGDVTIYMVKTRNLNVVNYTNIYTQKIKISTTDIPKDKRYN